jgi:hypothetical protein
MSRGSEARRNREPGSALVLKGSLEDAAFRRRQPDLKIKSMAIDSLPTRTRDAGDTAAKDADISAGRIWARAARDSVGSGSR